MSKYGVFSGLYFPVFGLNTEIYGVSEDIVSIVSSLVKSLREITENSDDKQRCFENFEILRGKQKSS